MANYVPWCFWPCRDVKLSVLWYFCFTFLRSHVSIKQYIHFLTSFYCIDEVWAFMGGTLNLALPGTISVIAKANRLVLLLITHKISTPVCRTNSPRHQRYQIKWEFNGFWIKEAASLQFHFVEEIFFPAGNSYKSSSPSLLMSMWCCFNTDKCCTFRAQWRPQRAVICTQRPSSVISDL